METLRRKNENYSQFIPWSGHRVVLNLLLLMNNNKLGTKPHYQILDGLRGIAAIIVVFFHLAEPLANNHLDNVVNHGYLAVDFFFLLSGFVIGYAYDDRWDKLTIGGFLRRRFERLQPLVVLGMTLGAIGFYFTDSTIWPLIHTVPVWKLIVVMLIGYTLLPIPLSMDIRGWQEMHPLNSVGWSLFFEYIANILYALGLRKLSNKALACFVVLAGAVLLYFAVTNPNGDITGGWTFNARTHAYWDNTYHISIFCRFAFIAGMHGLSISKMLSYGVACWWRLFCLCPE